MTDAVADPRTGEVRLKSEKCETCIFHPGNRMRLRPGRVKQMVDECRSNHGHVVCHDTLGDDVPGAICRGFADAYPGMAMALRLGAVFGTIVEV